jgi:hypothetical protein
MKSKSINRNSVEEIKVELEQSFADGFKPTLAIVFISVKQDRDSLRTMLDDYGIAIYGATTHGEFTEEGINRESISILFMDLNPAAFTIQFEEFPEKNYRAVTQTMAKKALKKFSNPAFLIAASNIETDAELLLFGFEDIAGKQVNIFGGMAGDDYSFKDQYVFTNAKSSDRGIVALVLDEDKVIINGRATCGWKAVGTEKTVTKSEGNHVYTVDDIPVLDITAKYGGIENLNKENHDLILQLASNFPLQLQRPTGDPVMRPALVIDWEDRSFLCSGSVPQGSKVRFSLPPDFDVVEKVIKSCEEVKEKEMPEIDALVVFSCAGRQYALGPMISQEMEGVSNIWKAPMIGMFSNGELGRATGGNLEMHNLTTCWVALKEK